MQSNIRYPYGFNAQGRTATVDDPRHIRELIEQVLFTAPGERVNRPEFGSGLRDLLFGGNNSELAATVQFLVQGALQRWLSDLITVEAVSARVDDSALIVTVRYAIRQSGQTQINTFTQAVPS